MCAVGAEVLLLLVAILRPAIRATGAECSAASIPRRETFVPSRPVHAHFLWILRGGGGGRFLRPPVADAQDCEGGEGDGDGLLLRPPGPNTPGCVGGEEKMECDVRASRGRKHMHGNVTKDELAKLFHLRAPQAASHFGLRKSAFKMLCRRCGVIKWPYRRGPKGKGPDIDKDTDTKTESAGQRGRRNTGGSRPADTTDTDPLHHAQCESDRRSSRSGNVGSGRRSRSRSTSESRCSSNDDTYSSSARRSRMHSSSRWRGSTASIRTTAQQQNTQKTGDIKRMRSESKGSHSGEGGEEGGRGDDGGGGSRRGERGGEAEVGEIGGGGGQGIEKSNERCKSLPKTGALPAKNTNNTKKVRDRVSEMCLHQGCRTRALYGDIIENKAQYCSAHKPPSFVHMYLRHCSTATCGRWASFGRIAEGVSRCAQHKLPLDLDLRNRRCQFGAADDTVSCAGSKAASARETIALVAPLLCNTQPSFGYPGTKVATRCRHHKLPGQIDLKNMRYRCRNPAGCHRIASFGHILHGRPLFCEHHKRSHDVNIRRASCARVPCPRQVCMIVYDMYVYIYMHAYIYIYI